MRHNDEGYVWVHVRGQAVWNEEREATRIAGSVDDITDKKFAETEQVKLLDKLTDSNEDLERFAYICSHDLQEPLRMVRSYTQRMELYFKDAGLDKNAQKYMGYISDGAVRAQGLIADILSYSRLNSENKQEDVDLNKTLDFVERNLEESIEERVTKITRPDLPTVTGNRILMIQLVQNLIGNAIKYCQKNRRLLLVQRI